MILEFCISLIVIIIMFFFLSIYGKAIIDFLNFLYNKLKKKKVLLGEYDDNHSL